MKIIRNLKYTILLGIFVIALICSILLSVVPLPVLCTPLEGCNTVQTSVYAKTAGIENSYLGIAIFGLMSLIIYSHIKEPHKHKKSLINFGVFLGAMIALYFLYLQEFVLHAFCKYCLVVDISMLVSFGVMNVPWKKRIVEIEKSKIEIKSN